MQLPDKSEAARNLPQTQKPGRSNPQLIPEFLNVVTCQCKAIPKVDGKRQLVEDIGSRIPRGSKLLRTEANKGGFLCVVGVYRSMQEFVEVSRTLWHPFDELKNLPDNLVCAIFDNLTMSPYELTKRRCNLCRSGRTGPNN